MFLCFFYFLFYMLLQYVPKEVFSPIYLVPLITILFFTDLMLLTYIVTKTKC